MLSYANAGMAPTDPEAVFGPPGGFYETGHNPPDLAANVAQTRVFMTTGDGTPAPDSTSATGGDNAKEGAIIRPTSDNYAAALRAAGVELVYHVHAGYHDWPNFHNELREMVAWGLFKPVDKHATSWVNDTVATHGKLWEFAYRFDAPPDRVVRFQRRGDILLVGAAGTPVTITTDGGCVIHANTPAEVDVPPAPCQRLSLTVSPTRLRAGRRGVVRVTVTPAIAGAVVRNGSQSAATDDHGTARLRLCVNPRSRLRITATATNYLPATALVRARGTPRRCGRS
jgi:hypothetical protein